MICVALMNIVNDKVLYRAFTNHFVSGDMNERES